MSISYVIDASVILKWYLKDNEPDIDQALLARERYLKGTLELVVPDLAFLETANRLSRESGSNTPMVWQLFQLFPRRYPLTHTQAVQAFELTLQERQSRNSKFTVYDAVYVVLAAHLDTGLLTADEPQAKAAKGLGCEVAWLHSYK